MKEYDWVQPTLERISDLLKMPDVHNSYGTPKVGPGCAWMALRMMRDACMPMLPVPIIDPTTAGGLGFTWIGLEVECAIRISPGSSAGLFDIHAGARKGGHVLDFAGFPQQCLNEMLLEISQEFAQSEPKP